MEIKMNIIKFGKLVYSVKKQLESLDDNIFDFKQILKRLLTIVHYYNDNNTDEWKWYYHLKDKSLIKLDCWLHQLLNTVRLINNIRKTVGITNKPKDLTEHTFRNMRSVIISIMFAGAHNEDAIEYLKLLNRFIQILAIIVGI